MRRRDIMSTYCTASSSDRFEFLYEYYHNYKNILSCERHCVIYMIESFMMKNHWEKYCKYYNSLNKNSLITRISECISKGEAIDFVFEDEELPEYILDSYKNYIAMRVDFRIFANALSSIGGKDEELRPSFYTAFQAEQMCRPYGKHSAVKSLLLLLSLFRL